MKTSLKNFHSFVGLTYFELWVMKVELYNLVFTKSKLSYIYLSSFLKARFNISHNVQKFSSYRNLSGHLHHIYKDCFILDSIKV